MNQLEKIPKDKDEDLRVFYRSGEIAKGATALELMRSGKTKLKTSGWPETSSSRCRTSSGVCKRPSPNQSAVFTMPPGKVMNAVLDGGWRYQGKDYPMAPDVFGMVDMGSMKKIRDAGKGRKYVAYMHNELVLMVAKGNPKKIGGIADLGRADLRIMLPNPVTEGIMKYYAKRVLQNNGLWNRLSQGKECQSCNGAGNVYFTSVHHREIPQGLREGKTDVGIVWATEYLNALKEGADVDAVALPEKDSMRAEIGYFAGAVPGGPHADAAERYLKFLGTEAGQEAYARHGFIKATKAELAVRDIE